MPNQVKFVICEIQHSDNKPLHNILKAYEAEMFWFADGDIDCFDPEEILKFETYETAKIIVDLAWNMNKTALGIAIWESDYPNEIEYRYVHSGLTQNLKVKANREETN